MHYIKKFSNLIFYKLSLFPKSLFAIFALALLIRFWGITYGFPIIFNIDEPSFVRSVIGLRFSLNPNRFDWPHTFMYINFVFYMLFYYFRVIVQFFGLRSFLESIFPILWHDPIIFYFISRVIAATVGALTVFAVFLLISEVTKSRKLGLYSSLLFAFIPFHVYESHLALLDVPMTFFVVLGAYFSAKLLREYTLKNFILSGVFYGLAFGTKYNALFYFMFTALVVFYYNFKKFKNSLLKTNSLLANFIELTKNILSLKNIQNYFYFIVSFLFAYLITNPTVITNFKLFWSNKYGRGFLFVFQNAGSKTWLEYPLSLYNNFVTESISAFGLGVYIFFILGFILFLFFNFRSKKAVLLITLPLFTYLYISKKDRSPPHYFIFVYPLIVGYVVLLIDMVSSFISKELLYLKIRINKNMVFLFIFYSIFSFSFFKSIKHSYLLSRPDTRNLAYSWLKKNVTRQDQIYYYRGDLEQIPFIDLKAKKLKRVDIQNINTSKLPFYLFVGVNGVSYKDLMEGDRDTDLIEGNISKFLEKSDLVFYAEPKNQQGPPVFIFKVYGISSK